MQARGGPDGTAELEANQMVRRDERADAKGSMTDAFAEDGRAGGNGMARHSGVEVKVRQFCMMEREADRTGPWPRRRGNAAE